MTFTSCGFAGGRRSLTNLGLVRWLRIEAHSVERRKRIKQEVYNICSQ